MRAIPSPRCSAVSICVWRRRKEMPISFGELGAPRVVMAGNLKLDVPAPPVDQAKLDRFSALTRGRPLFVAASTHPGEEEILIEMHRNLRHQRLRPDDGHRAAPSATRRSSIARAVAQAPSLRLRCARTDQTPSSPNRCLCRRHDRRTRGCSIRRQCRLCSWADRWSSMAARIHRGRQARRRRRPRAPCFNFSDIYEALDRAGGARRVPG